ncbi:MAG: FHA domain-containing protein, partial [Nocardioidaceae bacterium]
GVVVGRGSEADLRINDPGVSRRHVEIRVDVSGGQVTVSAIDLGSTNGTSMDGRRVQQALLHDGSTVVIGNTTMVVRNPNALNERSG